MKLTRRQTLGLGLGAAIGALTSQANAAVAPAKPSYGEGAITSQLKLSLAAYSFRDYLPQGDKAGKMTLHDLLDLAAVWRLDALEPTSYYFTSEDPAYLHSLKAKAFKLGLDISGTAIRNDFCLPPGEKRDAQIAHVKKWIDHSVLFGAPCIRIFAGNEKKGTDAAQALAWTIECCKPCCDYAGTRGVFLAIENHGYLTGTAEEVMKIVDGTNHEWLGVNLDTGNFTSAPYANMEALVPRAINVQVKVELRTADGAGKEPTDFARIAKILHDANYRGYVALEYEAKEDPMQAVPEYLAKLRKAIRT